MNAHASLGLGKPVAAAQAHPAAASPVFRDATHFSVSKSDNLAIGRRFVSSKTEI